MNTEKKVEINHFWLGNKSKRLNWVIFEIHEIGSNAARSLLDSI